MKEPFITNRMEPRWPVALAILSVLTLLLVLPGRIGILPTWVPFVTAIGSILPLVAVRLTSGNLYWFKVERTVMMILFPLTLVVNCANLVKLVQFMLDRPGVGSGLQLLVSGLAVWIINVLSFSLFYWVIDRGGPNARFNDVSTKPDWIFPNESIAAKGKTPDWKPAFVDYLFLAFCTATAFSPTDALPLTPRSKLLMMVQSMISLITIAVVLSRAINILGR